MSSEQGHAAWQPNGVASQPAQIGFSSDGVRSTGLEHPEMLPNLLTKEKCVRGKSWHVVVVVGTSEK